MNNPNIVNRIIEKISPPKVYLIKEYEDKDYTFFENIGVYFSLKDAQNSIANHLIELITHRLRNSLTYQDIWLNDNLVKNIGNTYTSEWIENIMSIIYVELNKHSTIKYCVYPGRFDLYFNCPYLYFNCPYFYRKYSIEKYSTNCASYKSIKFVS